MLEIRPILVGDNYLVRPLIEPDRKGLYESAKDPLTWEQHPAKDRCQRPAFDDYFTRLVACDGALAFEDIDAQQIVGCSRYYPDIVLPEEWSIGFTLLARPLWGGPANLEIKTLMLDHLFQTETNVWFHINAGNARSRRAVEKLGATCAGECSTDLLNYGDEPELFLRYCLTIDAWLRR